MRILFDQNVPRNLKDHLQDHEVTRAAEKGWQEFRNGDLLCAAEADGFDVFITCDQNIRYQQNVTSRKLAILEVTSNNWPAIRPHGMRIAEAVSMLRPGEYTTVECGPAAFRRRDRGSLQSS